MIISPLTLAQGDLCWDFIQGLTVNKNNPAAQTHEEKIYFAFSGMKGQNDLGSKSGCEENINTRYYVIGAILPVRAQNSKSYSEYETGICVPDFCDKEKLSSDPSQIRELCEINNYYTELHLVLNDPNADPPRGVAFYVFVCLFYILVAFALISTYIQNQTKILQVFLKNRKISYRSHWIFKAFDLVTTCKSLYSTAKESGQSDHLSMFGWIRLVSIYWIVAFHTLVIHRQVNNVNGLTGDPSFPLLSTIVLQGDMGPELFFFMAGFLAAFTLVGKATREGAGARRFLSDCWHRFLRTYPGFIVSLIFFWIVMPGMMNGPLWNRYLGQVIVCGEKWPSKFFLYSNFQINNCAGWSWYVFTDLHVYPLLILLSYMYASKTIPKRTTYAVVLILIAISFGIGLVLVNVEVFDPRPKFNWYNFSPARAGHLLIGMIFGFQYYEYAKLKLKNNLIAFWEKNAIARYISIIAGCALTLVTIFVGQGAYWEFGRRYLITVSVALTFMPLANNCSSVAKKILNLRFFQVLGKLGFGIFLLHWTIIFAINYTEESIPVVFDLDAIMIKTLKVFLLSLAASLVYHLLFEKPLLNIENHFTRRTKPTPVKLDPLSPDENRVILAEVVTSPSQEPMTASSPATIDKPTTDVDSSPKLNETIIAIQPQHQKD